ncbi:hypothetical protein CH371_19870 [Leptospira wolffii]|uniref:Uncharacterized protein n=1 Tax=Leptospira wolffii TaxID=409998 RepID=A0A2M9Z6W1_9LEPT|nr:hypothetical protein [Leptospira wolffii]PJZ64124.1 hypothetical protein CH371_19870 [Leptospira wolffii]
MNENNLKASKSAIEDITWLSDVSQEKFPEEIHVNFNSFKSLGIIFSKAFQGAISANVSDELMRQLNQYWAGYKEVIENLKKQAGGKPEIALNQLNSKLLTQFNQLSNTVITNGNTSFSVISSFLATFLERNLETIKIEKAISDYQSLSTQTTLLLDDLRKKSGDIGIEKFAEIFGRQARSQSRFFTITSSEKSRWNYLKLGAAERWLGIGIVVLLVPVYWFISPPEESTFNTISTAVIFIGRKLLFLSIWLFLVRFCFRNYSHYNFLAVQNTHRQNVLNSFRLLMEAIPSEDNVARSSLMQEVAKNIYVGGKNPFLIDNKKSDNDLQGILEMLKLLKH